MAQYKFPKASSGDFLFVFAVCFIVIFYGPATFLALILCSSGQTHNLPGSMTIQCVCYLLAQKPATLCQTHCLACSSSSSCLYRRHRFRLSIFMSILLCFELSLKKKKQLGRLKRMLGCWYQDNHQHARPCSQLPSDFGSLSVSSSTKVKRVGLLASCFLLKGNLFQEGGRRP